MNLKKITLLGAALCVGLGIHASPVILPVTYQGRLLDETNPANGQYEIRFGLFPAPTGGSELEALTNVVTASDGLFTTTLNLDRDLIPDPASGDRWLEIGVRTNGSASAFTELSTRQQLTFSPYAIRASIATLAENLPSSSVAGFNIQDATITANKIAAGEVVKNLNGLHDNVTLAPGANTTITPSGNMLTIASPTDWHVTGNAGTTPSGDFLGTTDNEPLELKVNGSRALRLEPTAGAPNLIGGAGGNTLEPGVMGSTIAGGDFNIIGTNYQNSSIVGGTSNVIGHPGGYGGGYSFIGSGANNRILDFSSFNSILSGQSNFIDGFYYSTILSGLNNTNHGSFSVIGGGQGNWLGVEEGSLIGGGMHNFIGGVSSGDVIAGGWNNNMGGRAAYSTISGGQWNTMSRPAGSTNVPEGLTIAGGEHNYAEQDYATISGGQYNTVLAESSTVGGGTNNTIGAHAIYSTIPGGAGNAMEDYVSVSSIGGGYINKIEYNAFDSVIGGGLLNVVKTNAAFGVIGGGNHNVIRVPAYKSVIGGGYMNTNAGEFATIPGGDFNYVTNHSFAAGHRAKAVHTGSFVWADDTDADFSSTTNDQFAIRANNGVMIQATNTALDIRGGGAIRVAGAGVGSSTPAFIHRATAANISGNVTYISNPQCDNDPNAILIVTQNWNPGGGTGTYNAHPVGVYYTGVRWGIFNEDSAAMPVNAAFNVLIIKQ